MTIKAPTDNANRLPMEGGLNRRRFLTTMAVGAGLAPLAGSLWRPLSARNGAGAASDLCVSPAAKPPLTAADFSYQGYYDVYVRSSESGYSQGFTHRYVGGDLRFMSVDLQSRVYEWSLGGLSYGGTVSTGTRQWNNVQGNQIQGRFVSLWWEEAKSRLWTMSTNTYNGLFEQVQMMTRTLNDDGTVGNVHGPVGLSGIPSKRVFGGAQAVPGWFQSQYGIGPYVVGWGGYTSLVAQGGGSSMGPALYAVPEPGGYASNSEIPTSAYKRIMDCVSGTAGSDWYASGHPTFDRGVRITTPLNYMDGNDPRQNPTTAPTAPLTSGNWLSPAPDGLGRWIWADSYYNTGAWIDGPAKSGYIAVGSFGDGLCYYGGSTVNIERRAFELHVFDPATLGAAVNGTIAPWAVHPSSMVQLSLPGLGNQGLWGPGVPGAVGGATYDPTTRKLYLLGMGLASLANRIYVYNVNA